MQSMNEPFVIGFQQDKYQTRNSYSSLTGEFYTCFTIIKKKKELVFCLLGFLSHFIFLVLTFNVF